MNELRTHYTNLQVTEVASDEVIRAAYRYLSQKYHPDKYEGSPEKAERYMRIINEAYSVLSDAEKRRRHDEWIARKRAEASRDTAETSAHYTEDDDTEAYDSAANSQERSDVMPAEDFLENQDVANTGSPPKPPIWVRVLLAINSTLCALSLGSIWLICKLSKRGCQIDDTTVAVIGILIFFGSIWGIVHMAWKISILRSTRAVAWKILQPVRRGREHVESAVDRWAVEMEEDR